MFGDARVDQPSLDAGNGLVIRCKFPDNVILRIVAAVVLRSWVGAEDMSGCSQADSIQIRLTHQVGGSSLDPGFVA